jgi:general secretion pathway protein M
MNLNLPTGARGRWVALGLLLVVIVVLLQLSVVPLWQRYRALAPAIAEQRAQLQRYQRLAAEAPQLEARLQSLQADAPFSDYLLSGTSGSLAAAALQQRLQNLVQEQDGRVLSTRVMRAQQSGDFEQVTVNARLQIDLTGLQGLLQGLETQTPYLYVENLNIFRRRGRSNTTLHQLEVQMDIYGLRLPGESEE